MVTRRDGDTLRPRSVGPSEFRATAGGLGVKRQSPAFFLHHHMLHRFARRLRRRAQWNLGAPRIGAKALERTAAPALRSEARRHPVFHLLALRPRLSRRGGLEPSRLAITSSIRATSWSWRRLPASAHPVTKPATQRTAASTASASAPIFEHAAVRPRALGCHRPRVRLSVCFTRMIAVQGH